MFIILLILENLKFFVLRTNLKSYIYALHFHHYTWKSEYILMYVKKCLKKIFRYNES